MCIVRFLTRSLFFRCIYATTQHHEKSFITIQSLDQSELLLAASFLFYFYPCTDRRTSKMKRTRCCSRQTIFVASVLLLEQVSSQDFRCNALFDDCPSKEDGVCDNVNGTNAPGCETTDCFDCNACSQFDLDCETCINARGCFWCPGDAACYNSRYEFLGSSCAEADYISIAEGTCLPPTNFFKYVKVEKGLLL